ncbi:retron Ec67 family RNA-directed DNA polymerase/endonuclease [Marinomonas spartinae]|uniref:retron Ec67 family RNA-directed DNA polymerase/endonuclease n=1 Tax=Marinomonas spartinae TaxID=1792290 RepID=UPI0018F27688|nr:retron Ec67 family RNA-directed DNA polymerase/endonuclease [Marinomonas spartinae]MBJ7556952.1 retron Ec67 family RNA-directed DNA polymerase/endonuclease [Marinomonas spartinae]
MSKLNYLRSISSKPEFAKALNISPKFLTHTLYVVRPENQYHTFNIDKKSGGQRTINAPSDELKSLQAALSNLLLDCVGEINASKYPKSQLASPKLKNNKIDSDYSAEVLKIKISNSAIRQPSLSHGFTKDRSIITNAMMHIGKKNILNIDLENFFDCFNFGRVRGFFLKNKNFQFNPEIATVIAQIACYENKLPQGSPCSPIITNLIAHSLDIQLASLARKYKCTYTRYADDITFSTNLSTFPTEIMAEEKGIYTSGKKLKNEIERAGFSINDKKTRIQYKNSRQDVTGLVVNKKPNVKNEYWRTVRAKCNSLFKTGRFMTTKNGVEVEGNINELEGQLNFIDQIDHYNRMRQKPPLVSEYAIKKIGINDHSTKELLTGREKTFSQFLYYKSFYGNDKPTILCEGKTDNIYLKSAISELAINYPNLASFTSEISKKGIPYKKYNLLVNFFEYSRRTRFFLELFGGVGDLKKIILNFEKSQRKYQCSNPKNPVIILLDNDTGPKDIVALLQRKPLVNKITLVPQGLDPKTDVRKAQFIHVTRNLYVIFTPLDPSGNATDIEYFFDDKTRLMKYSGKCFNTVKNRNGTTDLSKDNFATHIVKAQKKGVDFNGLKPLLDSIVSVIKHYDTIK